MSIDSNYDWQLETLAVRAGQERSQGGHPGYQEGSENDSGQLRVHPVTALSPGAAAGCPGPRRGYRARGRSARGRTPR